MAEVIVTEDQPVDDGAAQVAGAAAMASGAALAGADAAGQQAQGAQVTAVQAQQEAAAARAEAEAARIAALDAREATAELARLQLSQAYAAQQREAPAEPVATAAVVEEPTPVDEPPKSVAKKQPRKSLKERWGG